MSAVLPRPARHARRTPISHRRVRPTSLDVVHEHVLATVGDPVAARRVLTDVVLRANARTAELGETPTTSTLLRHADARLAGVRPAPRRDHDAHRPVRAPADLQSLLVVPRRRPLRRLVWLAPVAATLAITAAALSGLPEAVAAVADGEFGEVGKVPVATAEAVTTPAP